MSEKMVSVHELKTFIDACEFIADTEQMWVPSARQWAKIREMIRNLNDGRSVDMVGLTYPSAQPTMVAPIAPPQVPTFAPPPVPAGPSVLPPVPDNLPSAPPPHSASLFAVGGTARTPHIDTSDGNYQSAFL